MGPRMALSIEKDFDPAQNVKVFISTVLKFIPFGESPCSA